MGRQVYVLLHGSDYPLVGRYVEDKLAGIVVPDRWTSGPEPLGLDDLAKGLQRYVLPRRMINQVDSLVVQNTQRLQISRSPAVEWVSYLPFEGEHRPGRFYYEPMYVDDHGWRNKPDEFIRFADRLLRWVRRFPTIQTAWGKVHLGPEASAGLEAGTLRIAEGERPGPDEYAVRFHEPPGGSE